MGVLSVPEEESSRSTISVTNLTTWGPMRTARVLPVTMAMCLVLGSAILEKELGG